MRGEGVLRREMVAVCRRLWERGLIAGPEGNVSVRSGANRVLVTPAGMSKVDLAPDDLVAVTLDGRRARAPTSASSELAVHIVIYSARPDVRAVVHAHPPIATAFAVAGEVPNPRALPEGIVFVGNVALIPYERPGTQALADRLAPALAAHDAFLLANHGAVTVGPSLTVAHQRMECLEQTARILLAARLVGRVNELSPAQVAELVASRPRVAGAAESLASPASRRRRRDA